MGEQPQGGTSWGGCHSCPPPAGNRLPPPCPRPPAPGTPDTGCFGHPRVLGGTVGFPVLLCLCSSVGCGVRAGGAPKIGGGCWGTGGPGGGHWGALGVVWGSTGSTGRGECGGHGNPPLQQALGVLEVVGGGGLGPLGPQKGALGALGGLGRGNWEHWDSTGSTGSSVGGSWGHWDAPGLGTGGTGGVLGSRGPPALLGRVGAGGAPEGGRMQWAPLLDLCRCPFKALPSPQRFPVRTPAPDWLPGRPRAPNPAHASAQRRPPASPRPFPASSL